MVSEVGAEVICPCLGMVHDLGPHTVSVLTRSLS